MVLRDYEDEYLPLEPKTKNGYGDSVLESKLFYYYKDEAEGTDQAAAWLMSGENRGQKEIDLLLGGTKASYNLDVIKARFPDHISYLETVKLILAAYNGELTYADGENEGALVTTYTGPAYDVAGIKEETYTYSGVADGVKIYVPAHEYVQELPSGVTIVQRTEEATTLVAKDGKITITHEQLSRVERLWRQGAMTVIENNVIIGGGFTDADNGTAERKALYNASDDKDGFIQGMSRVQNNYIEQGVSVMPGIADGGYELSDYEISDDAWNVIAESVSSVEGLKKQNYKRAGRTLAEFAD
jgi:hypothetical protein